MNLDLNEMMMEGEVATGEVDLELADVIRDGVAFRWCPHRADWKCLGFAE